MSDQFHEQCIDTLRFLSVDMMQHANSGHSGLPLGAAPMAYALWTRQLKHHPANPPWADRGRFVLSAGHGSALLYSLLHVTGDALSLEDLRQFRQGDSKTPGHPERGHTLGVEVSTGPLGQGLANAVGMAIGEARLAACYNRGGHVVVDHHTWAIVSEGDLMESVAAEADSHAGHLKLGKLICLYDDNSVTLSAGTGITFSEARSNRFEAYGWRTIGVADGNDAAAINDALDAARADTTRPLLIPVRTHLGFASPQQDSYRAHGSPLGVEGVRKTQETRAWPADPPFLVPELALAHFRKALDRGAKAEADWNERLDAYIKTYPELANELHCRLGGELPDGWDASMPVFPVDAKGITTRVPSGNVMNALAKQLPALGGGPADLAPSTHTALKGLGDFNPIVPPDDGTEGADAGGLPCGSTFLIFSDCMRPAIRLAALMNLHVVHVFTHDSIALGEDGPSHQPVEQLASLRAIPTVCAADRMC